MSSSSASISPIQSPDPAGPHLKLAGKNLALFFFPDKPKEESPLAEVTKAGLLSFHLGKRTFNWKTPLDVRFEPKALSKDRASPEWGVDGLSTPRYKVGLDVSRLKRVPGEIGLTPSALSFPQRSSYSLAGLLTYSGRFLQHSAMGSSCFLVTPNSIYFVGRFTHVEPMIRTVVPGADRSLERRFCRSIWTGPLAPEAQDMYVDSRSRRPSHPKLYWRVLQRIWKRFHLFPIFSIGSGGALSGKRGRNRSWFLSCK